MSVEGNGVVTGEDQKYSPETRPMTSSTVTLVTSQQRLTPESYEDLELEFSPSIFSSLEGYLTPSMLGVGRNEKVKFMREILVKYLPLGERNRAQRQREYRQKIMSNYQMANTSTLSLRSILEKDNILLGSNYQDWNRKLKIVLRHERKIYVLEDEPLKEPAPDASEEDQSYYSQYMEDALDVQCIMLSSMSPELQRQHENMSAREIDQHLRELFQESARVERYETSRALFRTMLVEGNQVGPHVLKMIGYIERLESLGSKLDQDLAVDLVLSSLPPSFSQFVLNFNMNRMGKSLIDLMAMLKIAEKYMKVNPSLRAMMIRKTNKRPNTGKFNNKANAVKNPGYQVQKKLKKGIQVSQYDVNEAVCYHCGKKGHWKKNCCIFMKKNDSGADASGSK